jgi:hypothetical protein
MGDKFSYQIMNRVYHIMYCGAFNVVAFIYNCLLVALKIIFYVTFNIRY